MIVRADSTTPELNEILCEFAKTILGREVDFGPCSSFGFLRAGKLMGAMIVHDWRPEYKTVEVTCAALHASWCGKETLREFGSYCFDRLEANQVYARCDINNKTTTEFLNVIGCDCIELPNMRGPGRSELFFFLTRENWSRSKFNFEKKP